MMMIVTKTFLKKMYAFDDHVIMQILQCCPVTEWKNVALLNSQWHFVFSSELFAELYLTHLMQLSQSDLSKLKHTLSVNVEETSQQPHRKKKKGDHRVFWKLLNHHLEAMQFLDGAWKDMEKKVKKRQVYLRNKMIVLELMSELKKQYENRLEDELVIRQDGKELGRMHSIGDLVQLQHVYCKPCGFNEYSNGEFDELNEQSSRHTSIRVNFVILLRFGYALGVKAIYQSVSMKGDEKAIQQVHILDKKVFSMKMEQFFGKIVSSLDGEYLSFLQEHVFHVTDEACLSHFTPSVDSTQTVDAKKLFNTVLIKFFNPNFFADYHLFEDGLLIDIEKTFNLDGIYYESLFGQDF